MRLLIIVVAAIISSINSFSASSDSSSGGDVTQPDNSTLNRRDLKGHEPTAQQQGQSLRDTEISRHIRQAIMKDKSLSIYAKNIKIITNHGEVTLKGPVHSIDEQKRLADLSQKVAGVNALFNQTDVMKAE